MPRPVPSSGEPVGSLSSPKGRRRLPATLAGALALALLPGMAPPGVPAAMAGAPGDPPHPAGAHASPEAAPVRWGADGHRMAARAAAATLPEGMPAFFLRATEELVWLNPEPDRWRDARAPEMDEAWRYDHYIDLENIPDPAILDESPSRWDFFQRLLEAGVENPRVQVGFAPFAVLEHWQRLAQGMARWRATSNPHERRWLEARIVADAGILGHFVTDLSQPHHTTIHFNGWDEAQVPNPGGFTTDRGFHARFESAFVSTHLRYEEDLLPRVEARELRVVADDARAAIWAYVRETNSHVEELYRIDRDHGFGPASPPDPVSLAFAADRLADGAAMLRDLWWSAWMASAPDPDA